MKKTYSYQDCYKILRINPNCSWAELRKSYKKSIQKWHPDRFKDASKEKLAAEDKIKVINIAYNQLNKYYKSNGALPLIVEKSTAAVTPKTRTSTSINNEPTKPKVHTQKYQKKEQNQQDRQENKGFSRVLQGLAVALITGSVYYLYSEDNYFEEPNNLDIRSMQTVPINTAHASLLAPVQKTYLPDTLDVKSHVIPVINNSEQDERSLIEVSYFTNGSSFADVIDIMGVPTKTEDDIWFYGASEVHFIDGKVSHWVRNIDTPLKAKLTLN